MARRRHRHWGVVPNSAFLRLRRNLLGLAGDSSDNIRSARDRTEQLLRSFKYGSMEGLLASAAEIKGKRGENLREFGDQALLSRALATIKVDVPVEVDAESFRMEEPDANIAGFRRQLNFKRILSEFSLEDKAVSKVTGSRQCV